ncbi:MAG: SEC-C metal-binding domain-containing protein [Proteobacteria bacterium]|nr:SEC-C metal-binding domain-containing protein [Pseudomonadota bacterium]
MTATPTTTPLASPDAAAAGEHVHGPNCSHDHHDHHHHHAVQPFVRATPKLGRNDPCSCGSGKKYKKCCAGDHA